MVSIGWVHRDPRLDLGIRNELVVWDQVVCAFGERAGVGHGHRLTYREIRRPTRSAVAATCHQREADREWTYKPE
jgi:hypothetical protein